MADIYVRSSDGSDADNGSTWALAKATLAGAAAIDAAGDNIYLSSAHSESTASALSFAFAGTIANPIRVISVSDAAEPPTASAAGAVVATTGASSISMNAGSAYFYGIQFNAGSATSAASIIIGQVGDTVMLFESCGFRLNNTASNQPVSLGGAGSAVHDSALTFRNCEFRFGAVTQRIQPGYSTILIEGGGTASGTTSPTNLFSLVGYRVGMLVSSFDISALSSGVNLVAANGVNGSVIFRNCKLPASWSGSLVSGTHNPGLRVEMHNCDSADTNYRLLIADGAGTIRTETTIVRSGGASDGTTPFSWAMVSNTVARYPLIPLVSPELVVWNGTVGGSITVAVEVVTDGVTLNDDECWLEVQYLGASGFPLGTIARDAKPDVLAAAAAQTSSSAAWTTTGLTTPVKQKLSVTFTPQEAGHLQAVVKLAKASTTVYVDPDPVVT